MTTIKAKLSDVAPITRAAFPSWRGRKARVRPVESMTLHDLNWSGGTRSQYVAIELATLRRAAGEHMNMPAPWANPFEGKQIALAPGLAIVEHCIFCGKDLGCTIYVHPADMPRLLPGPAADLDPIAAHRRLAGMLGE